MARAVQPKPPAYAGAAAAGAERPAGRASTGTGRTGAATGTRPYRIRGHWVRRSVPNLDRGSRLSRRARAAERGCAAAAGTARGRANGAAPRVSADAAGADPAAGMGLTNQPRRCRGEIDVTL
jgi:hypothetical protein